MLKNIKFTLYIMMYLIILALTGVLNVVIFKELDWSFLLQASFWTPIIINNSLYFATFVVTVLLVYDILEYRDEDYLKMEMDIMSLRDELVGDSFKQHIINKNFYEKKSVWLQLVNAWITNLQSKLKHKVTLVLKTTTRNNWTKKAIKYEHDKETLNEYKSKKWIDDNLMFRKYKGWGFLGKIRRLHYPEVTVNEVIYGTIKQEEKKSLLERRVVLNQIFTRAFIMILSLTLTIINNLLQVERWVSTVDIFIALAIMFLTMLINVGVGVFGGNRAHKGRLANTSLRLGVVVDYKQGKRYEQAPIIDYESNNNIDDVVDLELQLE